MNSADVLATFALALGIAAALVFCALVRPERIACPPGWTVDGVRLDGTTACARASTAPETRDTCCGRGCACSGDVPDEPRVPVRIYCTGGAVPLVVDHRTVGCQRFHGIDTRSR